MSKKRVARSVKGLRSKTVSRKFVEKTLSRQNVKHKFAIQKLKAEKAARHFRPLKSERGQILFIGIEGQRYKRPGKRKGYLIYVDSKGKKKLLKQKKNQYRATRFQDAYAPRSKKFRKQSKFFTTSQRVRTSLGEPVLRVRGKVISTGIDDFNERIVRKISRSIRSVFNEHKSHRIFVVRIIAVVELPDGTRRTYETATSIEKPDHIAIQLAGMENFVRRKFYAFMARELQFDGLVSSGSANHIRSLESNRGKERSTWLDDSGGAWRGRDDSIVRIKTIEWKLEQAK